MAELTLGASAPAVPSRRPRPRAYLAAHTPASIAAHAGRPAAPHDPAAALLGAAIYLPRTAVAGLIAAVVETALTADDFAQVERAILATADAIVGAAALAIGRNVNRVRKGGRHGRV